MVYRTTMDPLKIISSAIGQDELESIPFLLVGREQKYGWQRRVGVARLHSHAPFRCSEGSTLSTICRKGGVAGEEEAICIVGHCNLIRLKFISFDRTLSDKSDHCSDQTFSCLCAWIWQSKLIGPSRINIVY